VKFLFYLLGEGEKKGEGEKEKERERATKHWINFPII
jgi:hypothetical protein